MISILIALLLTLSTGGDLCQSGQVLGSSWSEWVNAHPNAQAVVKYEATAPNFWIYTDDRQVVLFVFKEPIADTLARGEYGLHGQCARLLDE